MDRLSRSASIVLAAALSLSAAATAQVCNLKVVTDASPDYTDMDSLVHSITSNWKTDKEKCWALFYWMHIARRQTMPMSLHGYALTDPIRQFNDYGFAMCSTISGINCSIWQYMGYPVKYYDIAVHTVPEVFYDNAWHHYDNSLSAIYTLCDGTTIAGIQDIGKTLGCEASGGKQEAGHIALYHCLNGTGPDGFLEGADTNRDLRHLGEDTFKPEYLKYRYYLNDAERVHRYILNLRDNEVYTRHYTRLDREMGVADQNGHRSDPAYFVPNGNNKDGTPYDTESANPRYRIRGNGVRTFEPKLDSASLANALHQSTNIQAPGAGLQPAKAGEMAHAIFKVEGANVITSLKIMADLLKISADDTAAISISTNNGITWTDVWKFDAQGSTNVNIKLVGQISGAYEVLVRVSLQANGKTTDVQLQGIKFETITQVNSKTQPKLNLGKNTVYVGAGEQTESIVLWPELQADTYKPVAFASEGLRTDQQHEGWHGVLHPAEEGKEGFVIFKIDTPQDLTKITQSARMYVRAQKSEIRFEHSFDGGKTWAKSFAFNNTESPFDDLHDQVTTDIPAGTKSVQFKYILKDASLYSIRMEANHKVADASARPMEVTFDWSERQADYSLVKRSHTQLVEKLPATYAINVGGADHPVVESLTINPKGARGELKYGYSDGKDVGGEKYVGQWVTYGKNLAQGKPYTSSIPSSTYWEAGDPDGKKLTDGRVGSSYSGGSTFREGPLWTEGQKPEITVDLGTPQKASVFRIHIHGYEAKDAVRGQVPDEVEVLVSNDGKEFKSAGKFDFNLRWKDIPANYMWTDEETFHAHNHTLKLAAPVEARYVKFAATAARFLLVTEVQVLDGMKSEPFDLKLAMPKQK